MDGLVLGKPTRVDFTMDGYLYTYPLLQIPAFSRVFVGKKLVFER